MMTQIIQHNSSDYIFSTIDLCVSVKPNHLFQFLFFFITNRSSAIPFIGALLTLAQGQISLENTAKPGYTVKSPQSYLTVRLAGIDATPSTYLCL